MNTDTILIIGFLIFVIIVFIVSVIISSRDNYKEELKEYNSGKCTKCGSELKLTKLKGGTRYYVCPKCLKVVEVSDTRIDVDPETGLFGKQK